MTEMNMRAIFAMSEPKAPEASRRTFLKISGGAGAGLILGLAAPAAFRVSDAAAAEGPLAPNPFVRIAPDNTVTVIIKHLDKGQGAATGLATLVAEELDASHDQIRTDFAPADAEKYKNFIFGVQGVGGSTGLSNSYEQYRKAGAIARAMLVAAAAKEWGVDASTIAVKGGVVSTPSGLSATFGELADKAAMLPVPADAPLKDPKSFQFIGKPFPRVDSPIKVKGQAKYTIDHQSDDMLVVTIVRPPLFGAKLKSYDASEAEKIKGVVKVLQIPQGVAILATSTWPALKAQRVVKATWDDSQAEKRSSSEIIAAYKTKLDQKGAIAKSVGNAEDGFKGAAKVIEVDFEFPYLAHAPMEPMNCVIRFDGKSAEIWTASQLQTADHATACGILNLKPENVQLHTVWAGGSFGRRAIADCHFVREACEVAKAYGKPVPIKVIWTREDDVQGGWYRPIYVHRIKAGLDQAGNIVAWRHRIVGQSILAGTPFEKMMVKDGVDATSVEGASTLPYAIPNLEVDLHTEKVGVPVLWWRSVGATHTAHATEHMIDVLAKEAGKDPVDFRLAMLKDHPRHAGVLKLAAEKAGWGQPAPAGIMRGVALHESFGSFVANIADVRLRDDGTIKVERVVCALDCGVAVNPDVVKAQMEGGLGYGLGAALKGAITLKDGTVEQTNFDGYDVLRISEMPHVDVHIVPSAEKPSGVGEPGTPVVLPAVANALLWGTGVRSTVMPLNQQKYKGQA
ncbi:xanthine dehydrogenase family protein molybdopterin-binding subunit [Hyphomicrobium sp.]|uniref:xanthine dehydrogenase family protein molybdopterin-binding subunit n=1 Tax=Hyphomicrobium sp. TaxID=82 RepID=UPI002D78E510|nr:xanthine dehydrogenase family protein molybdopterin-binding subunit [Hyphomicrobium sp.]HET6388236.1 xanthine dehydrogenase family protein molybdopterin-binding subunit [Hyphomicrobium sp.]